MLIKNTFRSYSDVKGVWKELALVVQPLYTTEHRKLDNGIMVEQIKTDSLPILTFLNCVAHIVNIINNDFGSFEVRALYDALDKANHHKNILPRQSDHEYEYCCERFYERTVIFGGVYYIISIENPKLGGVLSAVYNQANYHEGRPYLDHFIIELRKKTNGYKDGTPIDENLIPPHIIPDVQLLLKGYREFKPLTRLREFRKIKLAIEELPHEQRTIQIEQLNITIEFAIRILRRTYDLQEDPFIPDNEKVSLSKLLEEYRSVGTKDENGDIAAFLERVINSKAPSPNDEMYLELLKNTHRYPATQHAQQAEVIEDVAEDKPMPVFFRTDAQSITKIQEKWQQALNQRTKTGVIRFVKTHDGTTGYFKLTDHSNKQLAEEFNKAQTKYVFTESDFENANKPLKK